MSRLQPRLVGAVLALVISAVAHTQAPVATPPSATPTLDDVLVQVHDNFRAYLAAVPSIFADEHVVSSMTVHDEGRAAMSRSSTTDSIFRLNREQKPNRPVQLVESREVRAIDQHTVAAGDALAGPVVLSGAFGYGARYLAPELKQCYDYKLQLNQRLHGAPVLVVDYALKSTLPADSPCHITEQNSGKVYVDPASMQVVRVEQRRPRHLLDAFTSAVPGKAAASDSTAGSALPVSPSNTLASAMAVSGPPGAQETSAIAPGTVGVWVWSVDYAPVHLDNHDLWLPRTIASATSTISGRLVNWSFDASYSNYHLLTVHSIIRPAPAP